MDGLSRLWTGTRNAVEPRVDILDICLNYGRGARDESKELANIGKLEVAEITLQEARAQASEIVYAWWLDDVARRTPEDPGAVRCSEDATRVNAPDHEEEVQATTLITASRIILSVAATKVIVGTTLCSKCCLEKHDDMERARDRQVLGRCQEHPDG